MTEWVVIWYVTTGAIISVLASVSVMRRETEWNWRFNVLAFLTVLLWPLMFLARERR